MSTALEKWGRSIAKAALPIENLKNGPWRGSMESKSPDLTPREYAAGEGSSNFNYLPSTGTWKRRGGQEIQFDSASTPVGLLPAKWGGKARWSDEFLSPAVTDGIPTVCTLVTKEAVASGLDDGWFSNLWWRDRAANVNRTLGSEFDATVYPAPGAIANYRVTPLWYESGDGGLTRGHTEFARRFFVSGSRRFLKVGDQTYFPSLRGTPARWNGGVATAAGGVNRLIPSGPLPPTHAGTIVAGNLVVGELASSAMAPDADSVDGTWVNQAGSAVNLYQSIDEDPADATDYIQSPYAAQVPFKVRLSDLGFTPASDSTVTIVFRASRGYGSVSGVATVKLMEGAAQRAVATGTLALGSPQQFSYVLTSAELASITDWTNLFLEGAGGGAVSAGGTPYVRVNYARVTYTPAGSASEGAWRGHDRFLHSVAYRDESGAVWMPCTPRLPSATDPDGFNMFTVNANADDEQYEFVDWLNIPQGPPGTSPILLRSLKVDSTIVGEELKLNPYDLRVVVELAPGTTTYRDYQADDFGLAEDPAGLFIRYDHIMPPRARYIAGGDMRIIHAYGGRNPCAIEIAPIGRTIDYDLNLPDGSAALYVGDASFMRVRYDAASGTFLDLLQSNGAAATNLLSIDLSAAAFGTLQKLVDRINATLCGLNGQQWRAQLCPGANPEAPAATCLTPHYRVLASACNIISGQRTITSVAGGLSVVAVGTVVIGTGIGAGAYVERIDSDTQLFLSQPSLLTGPVTPSFEVRLGDAALAGVQSYQRVISNSHPGFLYFNATHLNADPVDKSSVWMTVATPGSMRSAANSFSGKNANHFKPPTNAGIVMGGAACGQGFVIPFSLGVYVLKNTRDSSSGIDEEYKLLELNPTRGCIAWNTVTPGGGFVPYLTPDGLCAADLEREFLISDHAFNHDPPTGSMKYEIQKCVAATGMDVDDAYASCRIMGSAIRLNYRESGTHPNRQVKLDFSPGHISSGLAALFRSEPLVDPDTGRVVAPAGSLFGWSTPLVRAVTAMCQGRRADGAHLYGWNDANAGSAGDGRIDEFDVGDLDNGVPITAEVRAPWERLGSHYKLSAQEIAIEHSAPIGASVFLDFHWSHMDQVSTLTPPTSSFAVNRKVIMLPQAARAATAECFVSYRQTGGPAAELKAFTLRAKKVPSYT